MMNKPALVFLLAIVATAISVPTAVFAYSQDLPPPCVGCVHVDPETAISQSLLNGIQISVQTDKEQYNHDDVIQISGEVAYPEIGYSVTITATNPIYNVVEIDQIEVSEDGTFEASFLTLGDNWKYDGIYRIDVYYGTAQRDNYVDIELVGGPEPPKVPPVVDDTPILAERTLDPTCGLELLVGDQCIAYSITGDNAIVSASLNTDDNSIVIEIESESPGVLGLYIEKPIQDGIYLVLVDYEEWNDVEIVGPNVTIVFPAGTQYIEIFGTHLIPEFGTIAMMILAVAVISVIVVSARSKLAIMPIR